MIADFTEDASALGDAYRVEAHIVIWENNQVLKIPLSALFRQGEAWSVFVVEEGRASRRAVSIGQRSQSDVEIKEGLEENAYVIVHPSNDVDDNVRVKVAGQP